MVDDMSVSLPLPKKKCSVCGIEATSKFTTTISSGGNYNTFGREDQLQITTTVEKKICCDTGTHVVVKDDTLVADDMAHKRFWVPSWLQKRRISIGQGKGLGEEVEEKIILKEQKLVVLQMHDSFRKGSSLKSAATALFSVRVLYDYEDTEKESLKLCKGDVIRVIAQLESGWGFGELNGNTGWFPNNYCQMIGSETLSTDKYHAQDNDISQIEDTRADNDSAIDIDGASDTTSIGSGVWDVVVENERTYHKYRAGKYLLPNDGKECDRLDFQHRIFNLSFGKLYFAPLPNVNRTLDIGTGTGTWAIEFATAHPQAQVLGTDLSPIQHTVYPINLEFLIDDAEDPWICNAPFDFIHSRMAFTYFTPNIVDQAFNNLSPGGYLEFQDAFLPFQSDAPSFPGSEVQKWSNLLVEAAGKLGKDWMCAARYRGYMERAGFVDVCESSYDWPLGPWTNDRVLNEVGRHCITMVLDWLEPLSMACLTRSGTMPYEQVQLLLTRVRDELRSYHKLQVYIRINVVWGRKPRGE